MTFAGLILFWKANAWFRYLCAAAALVGLWFALKTHYIDEGKKLGVKQATDEISVANKQQWEQMRAEFERQRDEMQVRLDSLAGQLRAYQETSRLLAAQRQQMATQVAGMTPAQVDAQINAYLGRQSQDTTPYTEADKKKLADCTAQLPLCEKQVETETAKNQVLESTLTLKDQQYALLGAYTTNVENAYVSEYNANKHKVRAWKCLRLWKCGTAQITAESMPPLLKTRPVER